MTVYVVTGTDIGVGKTVVAAALAVALQGRGVRVAVVKPVQTGVPANRPGDMEEVRRLVGDLYVAEGVRLPHPLPADRAAATAGIELPSLCDQRDLVLSALAGHDAVVLEGTGGVTAPLGAGFGLLDVATMVREAGQSVEVLVVADPGAGSVNHASLTVEAIQARNLFVQGIVIGSWPSDPRPQDLHNRDDLAFHSGVPVLGAVPADAAQLDAAAFRAQASTWLPYLIVD
jgi:dethiobiotin synthetase